MKNSPTLCQKFVDAVLQGIREKHRDVYLVHYMDDILLAHPGRVYLQEVLIKLQETLSRWGLKVAPEKNPGKYAYNISGKNPK